MRLKPQLLVILQCPWRKGELANGWDREIWLRLLWGSQTGIRLKEALPHESYEIEVCNANPTLADSPDGVFPPDLAHLKKIFDAVQPDVVLACGNVAKAAVRELDLPMPVVEMPHPAFRCLSKQMTQDVKQRLLFLALSP